MPEPPMRDLAPRVKDFAGGVLGFLDNRKHNGHVLLGGIEAALTASLPISKTTWRQKAFAGLPAEPEILDVLATCRAVIVGLGD